MDDKKNNIEQFFDREIPVGKIENIDLESRTEKDFITAYRKLISKNNDEGVPGFNLFEKIEQQKKKRKLQFRRTISYAATVIALVGFFSLFYYFNKPQQTELSNIQLTELRKETQQTLLYFSREFNETLKSIKTYNLELESISDAQNFKIEIENPMKNLDFN